VPCATCLTGTLFTYENISFDRFLQSRKIAEQEVNHFDTSYSHFDNKPMQVAEFEDWSKQRKNDT
jgi:hypothetical protein